MSKTVFIPRAKIPEELFEILREVAFEKRLDITDLIREALQLHPDISQKAETQGFKLNEMRVMPGNPHTRREEMVYDESDDFPAAGIGTAQHAKYLLGEMTKAELEAEQRKYARGAKR